MKTTSEIEKDTSILNERVDAICRQMKWHIVMLALILLGLIVITALKAENRKAAEQENETMMRDEKDRLVLTVSDVRTLFGHLAPYPRIRAVRRFGITACLRDCTDWPETGEGFWTFGESWEEVTCKRCLNAIEAERKTLCGEIFGLYEETGVPCGFYAAGHVESASFLEMAETHLTEMQHYPLDEYPMGSVDRPDIGPPRHVFAKMSDGAPFEAPTEESALDRGSSEDPERKPVTYAEVSG